MMAQNFVDNISKQSYNVILHVYVVERIRKSEGRF